MRALTLWFIAMLRALYNALKYLVLFRWLRDLVGLISDLIGIWRRTEELEDHRRGRDPRCIPKRCGGITPDVYRRPDPLIYSQRYLREQGLAVTWDNPDIQLFRNGASVASSSLEASTEYEIRARIWNNSTDAPAVGLNVEFFFNDFGIGPAPIAIGTDTITLPVKGAPGHPATARTMWTTPTDPGHYCVKVQLHWADDANPKNNLGQENTNVGTAASPVAFRFPVHNESTVRRTLRLFADAYAIPEPLDCRERSKQKKNRKKRERAHRDLVLSKGLIPPLERDADWTLARIRHRPEAHTIPEDWSIRIQPDVLDLAADETRNVEVTIRPPDTFVGQRAINVNAMHGTDLVGGVTLAVNVDQEG